MRTCIYWQRQRCSPRSVVSGNMSYADIRRGSLLRWCQIRVRSSKMRLFSIDRYIFRMKFPTGFTYRNLHGFARFPGDSTALVIILSLLPSFDAFVDEFVVLCCRTDDDPTGCSRCRQQVSPVLRHQSAASTTITRIVGCTAHVGL